MLVFQLFECYLDVFPQLALLILVDQEDVLNSKIKNILLLFVEIEGHDMILFQVFDFSVLIDEFTLLIFELFLGDNPIVIDPFPLFLEVCQ